MKVGIKNIFGYTVMLLLLGGCAMMIWGGSSQAATSRFHFNHAGRIFVCHSDPELQAIANNKSLGIDVYVCATEKK